MLTEVRTRYRDKETKLFIGSDLTAMIKGITRVERFGKTLNSRYAKLTDVQDAYNNRI